MQKPDEETIEMRLGPADERALLIAALDLVLGDEAIDVDRGVIGNPPTMRPRFFEMEGGVIHLELVAAGDPESGVQP